MQNMRQTLIGSQQSKTYEWRCSGWSRAADQETHWCFTSLAMAQPSLTTAWMRLMAMMKRYALWILRPKG